MHADDMVMTHDDHHDADVTDVFGFWLYIMTDVILFACLFATFLVLTNGMYTGPTLKNFIELDYVLVETLFLLASNFTFCLAILNLYRFRLHWVQAWLIITFILGASFVAMEIAEFVKLYHEGFRWNISGEASAFFTLVGTHGLHVSIGLLWIMIMVVQLPLLKINPTTERRMTYLGLFWNFLDIVWIFVFTIVYLMEAM